MELSGFRILLAIQCDIIMYLTSWQLAVVLKKYYQTDLGKH